VAGTAKRTVAPVAVVAFAVVLLPLLLAIAVVSDATGPSATNRAGVPSHLVPLYRAAASVYNVHWLLLAAVHWRETDFSRLDAPGVRDGWNGCGAAGPMQLGIVGVEPYNGTAPDCGALTSTGAGPTWRTYRNAYKRVEAAHVDRARPPACDPVPENIGCVYADTDAIAAAGAYLHDLGAREELDARAWNAARRYNGAAVYADAVLERAKQWQSELRDDVALTDPPTTPGARARLGSDGLARAPENAPPEVKRAIAAANAISDKPYELRHFPTHIGNPTYDCSSSSSHVLWGARAFGTAPWVSGQFIRYGKPGPGRWITVYANDGHMFLVVAGLRFDTARYDTGPNAGESGPRWRMGPRPTAGFAVRHPDSL
jgi:hypothetical protein